jgi:F-type H+-transporting ATPase subunit gamma
MASPRDLRRRIRSISGTAQITRAMQMVAASKMRRAQQAAIESAPFARRLYRMQRAATARIKNFRHPLLAHRPVHQRAVILIAGDKGLCNDFLPNEGSYVGKVHALEKGVPDLTPDEYYILGLSLDMGGQFFSRENKDEPMSGVGP